MSSRPAELLLGVPPAQRKAVPAPAGPQAWALRAMRPGIAWCSPEASCVGLAACHGTQQIGCTDVVGSGSGIQLACCFLVTGAGEGGVKEPTVSGDDNRPPAPTLVSNMCCWSGLDGKPYAVPTERMTLCFASQFFSGQKVITLLLLAGQHNPQCLPRGSDTDPNLSGGVDLTTLLVSLSREHEVNLVGELHQNASFRISTQSRGAGSPLNRESHQQARFWARRPLKKKVLFGVASNEKPADS